MVLFCICLWLSDNHQLCCLPAVMKRCLFLPPTADQSLCVPCFPSRAGEVTCKLWVLEDCSALGCELCWLYLWLLPCAGATIPDCGPHSLINSADASTKPISLPAACLCRCCWLIGTGTEQSRLSSSVLLVLLKPDPSELL